MSQPHKVSLDQAVLQLLANDVVAIPTETVYGLAARIDSAKGIELIFKTKQRPFFDPLIVHVKSAKQAQKYVNEWPLAAQVLVEKFWPGPLTLVLEKNALISPLITSGLSRVGLRCPSHPLALQLLEKIDIPLAAPSANLFGRTSPTKAEHVLSEFVGTDLAVLDGGDCEIGIESTVVLLKKDDSSNWCFSILRPGFISAEQIKTQFNEKQMHVPQILEVEKGESPGQMKHHYMPDKPLVICQKRDWSHDSIIEFFLSHLSNLPDVVEGVKIKKPLAPKIGSSLQAIEFNLPQDSRLAARVLYSELRRASQHPGDLLIYYSNKVEQEKLDPLWSALNERLYKAATLVIPA